jgi:hypothetical protein
MERAFSMLDRVCKEMEKLKMYGKSIVFIEILPQNNECLKKL